MLLLLRMLLPPLVPPHSPALPHHHRRAHSRAPLPHTRIPSLVFAQQSCVVSPKERYCAPVLVGVCTSRRSNTAMQRHLSRTSTSALPAQPRTVRPLS